MDQNAMTRNAANRSTPSRDTARGSARAAPATGDGERWAAVLRRSGAHDGAFVYAVRTTRVYCRPGCPSRRPRRENVSFFASPAEAERAGFRACLRCRPAVTALDAAAEYVRRASAVLEAHVDERVTLATLAQEVGLSPWHLQRVFRRATGVSPREWVAHRRLGALKHELRKGRGVATATYEAGFGSSRAAYELSARRLGMTPAVYAKGGAGQRIRYVTLDAAPGRMLVAATRRGVCAVLLDARDAALEASLAREFPGATRERVAIGRGRLTAWARAIARQAAGHATAPPPLDLCGTAFQLRVWQALREIPSGATRSYAAIARRIGRPAAARAVAGACAGNRVAIAVPCHRVTPRAGGVGGYRWGVRRKRALLRAERQGAAPRSGSAPRTRARVRSRLGP